VLDAATPLQLEVLDESHPQSRTSPYYLTLAHQPLMLRHRSAAYNAIMYAPGGLPRAERELGAMVVSVSNGCVYCTFGPCAALRAAGQAQRHRRAGVRRPEVGRNHRARARHRPLRHRRDRAPRRTGGRDIAPLRDQGMSDEEIIDLLHAVAIFGWANRLMQNLGEPAGGTSDGPPRRSFDKDLKNPLRDVPVAGETRPLPCGSNAAAKTRPTPLNGSAEGLRWRSFWWNSGMQGFAATTEPVDRSCRARLVP
jgi:uncharacterized peroxidase-related enzyme